MSKLRIIISFAKIFAFSCLFIAIYYCCASLYVSRIGPKRFDLYGKCLNFTNWDYLSVSSQEFDRDETTRRILKKFISTDLSSIAVFTKWYSDKIRINEIDGDRKLTLLSAGKGSIQITVDTNGNYFATWDNHQIQMHLKNTFRAVRLKDIELVAKSIEIHQCLE